MVRAAALLSQNSVACAGYNFCGDGLASGYDEPFAVLGGTYAPLRYLRIAGTSWPAWRTALAQIGRMLTSKIRHR